MLLRIILLAGLLALILMTVPVLAGGWVVITLEELPEAIRAGEPIRLTFMVRQHGQTPTHDLSPLLVATNRKTGESIHVEAKRALGIGRFSVEFTFPSGGEWEWSMKAEPFSQTITLAPVNVLDPDGIVVQDTITPTREPWQIFLRWGGALLLTLATVLIIVDNRRPSTAAPATGD